MATSTTTLGLKPKQVPPPPIYVDQCMRERERELKGRELGGERERSKNKKNILGKL